MATTTQPHSPATAHGHGHEHGHPAHLAHHFDTPAQQKEAATIGMWAFLITEIMLFGGLFMAYIVYRWAFPDVWAESAHHLNTPLGTVNTVVLLVSSLTVALSVHAAEHGNMRRVVTLIGVTILLGFAFLGIKAWEYSEKFAHCAGYKDPIAWVTGGAALGETECLVPGRAFVFPEAHAAEGAPAEATGGVENEAAHGAGQGDETAGGQATPYQLFYLLYFCSTGLHAIHMVIGITMMSIIGFMAARGRFSTEYFTPVELGGLYWHLIDIIWVFLFPLYYLVH